jgi:hypothetical protein
MNMMTLRTSVRVSLILLTLLVAGTLSAACNLVAPTETTSSDGEKFDITLYIYFSPFSQGRRGSATVSPGGGGAGFVGSSFATVTIPGMQKGGSFTVRAETDGNTATKVCQWDGKLGVIYDTKVKILDFGLGGGAPIVQCGV